ncbi:SSPO-like protein [Mya arenaria]|uniref:SSPO-like protein n=1 Tax=Mya arenaria TaxID=6604 RepID=A0ABY7DAH0_MYAAR|nr:SSPO-like protein [Mya arenaria]
MASLVHKPNWSPWSPWGDCDVKCGTGRRERTRNCDSPAPRPGQAGCPGDNKDYGVCTEKPCVCTFNMETYENIFGYEPSDQIGWIERDGTFGPTSPEEDVYVDDTMDEGVVVHVSCSNCTCDDGEISCEIGECEDCTYTEWSTWSTCSKTCDVGQTTRTRRLRNQSSRRPSKCKRVLTEREDCNLDRCPAPSECEGGMVWSECANRCPHTCMDVRLGTCVDDDDDCIPVYAETERWTVPKIQSAVTGTSGGHGASVVRHVDIQPGIDTVDGSWNSWSSWSSCSRSCAGGKTNRFRQCNSPLPQCGGKPCKGDNSESKPCNKNVPCCDLTSWSVWTDCSVDCGTGTRDRSRNYVEAGDQELCHDTLRETEVCKLHDCDIATINVFVSQRLVL